MPIFEALTCWHYARLPRIKH